MLDFREKDGRLKQRFFGVHTYRRTVVYVDWTRKEIIRALMAQVRQRKIEIMDNVLRHKIIEISARYWKKRWKGSWCIKGAIGIDVTKKKIVRFKCKSLILVSGGYTRVYEVSSSRIFENYEGVALAYQGRE